MERSSGRCHLKRLYVLVLLLVILGGISWWIYQNYDLVEIEEDTGYRGEARSNPLLAAERLLAALDIPVESRDNLVTLPPSDTTLLLTASRRHFGSKRNRRILAWVRAGGHLITMPHPGSEADLSTDLLLDAVGVHAEATDEDEDVMDTVSFYVPGCAETRASFAAERALVDRSRDALWWAEVNDRVHVLQHALGQGTVTTFSDLSFAGNDRIGQLDHATLLYNLARKTRQTWLVHDDQIPSIFTLLWKHAWMVLLSLGIVLVAWIWSSAARFGPVLPDPELSRRGLLEHIEAAGRFLWRQGHSASLLASQRQALLRRIEQRHPTWAKLSAPDLAERLSSRASFDAKQIRAALLLKRTSDPRRFTRGVRILESLRKSL